MMSARITRKQFLCAGGRARRSGAALLITVISLFLITAMTVGVLSLAGGILYNNNLQQLRAAAFNIAESGAELAALWLKDQPIPPNDTSPFNPFGGPVSFGGGAYDVTIIPAADNNVNFLKTFWIRSTGTVGNASRTVEIVLRQASFGRYAYFTDREVSSVSGGAIWWKAGELVDGPVHSNNTGGSNFKINYNGSTAPIFLDMVTGSGPTIDYTPGRPTTEAAFKRIFADGSKGFRLGVPRIELPPTTSVQKEAAWGGSSYPSTNGVYLRADAGGGIFIRGDAAITLGVDASGNQTVRVVQGTNTTVITIDKNAGTCTASGPVGPGSPTSTSSLPNGVIFCTGNITSLSGTVANNKVSHGEIEVPNALTIAVEVSNTNPSLNKDITITGNLVYQTRPDKNQPPDAAVNLAAGTLGLVARNIIVAGTAPQNLEINAVMMAGGQNTDGSFYVSNYNTKTPPGVLSVLGGIIQRSRGPVGTFNSSTGVTQTGYSKNYRYDPRLAANPPPYYPTTGQYERLSWQVLPD